MRRNKNSILPDYDDLLNRLQDANNTMQNLQREKDYKITTIANQYDAKIDFVLREINSLEIQIKNAVSYVNNNKKERP